MTHITLQHPAVPKDAGIIKFTMLLGGVVFLLIDFARTLTWLVFSCLDDASLKRDVRK